MPLQKMQDFTFKHSEQQDAIYTEYTAQQIKALFDSRGDELRTALNLLITALNSTEGASNVGTQSIQDLDGETIQAMLKSIRDKLKSKADGSSGADYVNATAIEGLTGETVQSLLRALKSLVDNTKTTFDTKIDTTKSTLENSISTALEGVKASTISADPIAVGSGTNVQAQLAWLLSQIAVAATGSIPDGSLTEAKLAQALVDKINKALTNTGLLTTLVTDDKSSLVNAVNEVKEEVASHKADYEYQTPSVVGTQIRLTKQSDTSRLFFKLDDNLTGNITISLDGGATSKNLVDVNGAQVTSLDKGFVEVVAYANFFILRNKGGLSKADLEALIDITNEAEANDDAIRAGVANALTSIGVSVSPAEPWVGLTRKIEQIEVFKPIPGTLIVINAPNRSDKTSLTPIKAKEIKWVFGDGVVRVSYSHLSPSNQFNSYSRVHINGSPVGALRIANTNGTFVYTQDFSVKKGDLIQVYVYAAQSYSVGVNEFKIGIGNTFAEIIMDY